MNQRTVTRFILWSIFVALLSACGSNTPPPRVAGASETPLSAPAVLPTLPIDTPAAAESSRRASSTNSILGAGLQHRDEETVRKPPRFETF